MRATSVLTAAPHAGGAQGRPALGRALRSRAPELPAAKDSVEELEEFVDPSYHRRSEWHGRAVVRLSLCRASPRAGRRSRGGLVVYSIGGAGVPPWLGQHDAVYRDLPTTVSMLVIATLVATTTLLWHFWTITRIRGRIRAGIAAAAADQRTPICLRCGYDCAATEGDACPECGTRLHVSS